MYGIRNLQFFLHLSFIKMVGRNLRASTFLLNPMCFVLFVRAYFYYRSDIGYVRSFCLPPSSFLPDSTIFERVHREIISAFLPRKFRTISSGSKVSTIFYTCMYIYMYTYRTYSFRKDINNIIFNITNGS